MQLPLDKNGKTMQLVPAKAAIARTYDTTISSATDVTLAATTRFLEVTAISQGIFMRYATTVTTSNFDEYIAAGMTRNYKVPVDSNGTPTVTVVSFIEQAASATLVMIEK